MTAAELCFGRRVRWRGQTAEIVDIAWRGELTSVRIRIVAGGRRWVPLSELEAL